jgi:hypothetical protein
MRSRINESQREGAEARTLLAASTGGRKRRYISLLAIGAIAALIGLAVLPAQPTAARETREGGSCSEPYSGCHSGAQTPSLLTITGLPSSSFVPGQQYTIHIVISDTNGIATGYNSFDLIINAGTLSTTDPEVEINNPASEASANDLADLMKATTFDVVWTAPLSSSANIEIWGVMGDGAGSMLDIWDREVYSYTAVPEFPVILLRIGLAVILASRISKKR